jgi:hypothetical protein
MDSERLRAQSVSTISVSAATMETVVEEWFGKCIHELHPLLQRLHRTGGVLSGRVQVSFGDGMAGVFGKRLATRLGVPNTSGSHHLQVAIHSSEGALHWARSFNGRSEFISKFNPYGQYPDGHWIERSGPLTLELGVKIQAGGWHWEHRKTRLLGILIPKPFLPTTIASKSIEQGRYRFSVEVKAPLLDRLLAYSGTLTLDSAIEKDDPALHPQSPLFSEIED